jgi:acetyl-CoA acetyltransferase
MARNPKIDWDRIVELIVGLSDYRVDDRIDDLIYGCANQAAEDNRNVGRMAALLAGLPVSVPANTINRLCGSGMDAIWPVGSLPSCPAKR